MKKILKISLLCCLVLLACVLLAACNRDGQDSQDPTQETETQAHVHKYGEWVVVEEATCTARGMQERVCACGAKNTQVLLATGHKAGEWKVNRAPTCTQPGTNYQPCVKCHVALKTSTTPAKGHGKSEWVVEVEPTCTQSGKEKKVCLDCEETLETRTLPKTAHTEVVVPALAPTCTTIGLTEGKYCSVCDLEILKQETVPATGHKVIVKPGKAPTCTEPGLTEGKYCLVCEDVVAVQEEIPPTHAWSGYQSDAEGHWRVCSVCGAVEQKIPHSAGSDGHCSVCRYLIGIMQ